MFLVKLKVCELRVWIGR